jgi:hypothetical protein
MMWTEAVSMDRPATNSRLLAIGRLKAAAISVYVVSSHRLSGPLETSSPRLATIVGQPKLAVTVTPPAVDET